MPRKAKPWYRRMRRRDGTTYGEWYVTLNGIQERLHVMDEDDEAAAFAAFRELLAKRSANCRPEGRPEAVSTLIAEYLDSIGHRINPKTRYGYECCLRRFAAHFGSSAAGDIDPIAVERRALAEGWSDSHRSNYLWSVQAFLRWCGRKDLKLSRPGHESRGAEAVITDDTHRLVLRETKGDFHELCRFLWSVGCRPMEAARLEYDAIDWGTGTVTIKRHKTKHKGKRRVLYLSPDALGILQEQAKKYNESGALFRGMLGKPFTIKAIVDRFIRVSEKIGRTVRAYDYRHTYITRALSQGIPDTHVAALVGHTNTNMLHKFYSHIGQNAALLRSAAASVN